MSAGWLPILIAGILGNREPAPRSTPSDKLPIQVIYRCKIGSVRHEIKMEYANETEPPLYLERNSMLFLPHRMRRWNEAWGDWDTWWEEVKPQPHIVKIAERYNRERKN